jgi:hypothetical protein
MVNWEDVEEAVVNDCDPLKQLTGRNKNIRITSSRAPIRNRPPMSDHLIETFGRKLSREDTQAAGFKHTTLRRL